MLRAHLTPAHTCIHTQMHVHSFRADFHLEQWKIYSKFKAARTNPFFFLEEPVTSSHFRPYNIYGEVWIHSFAPKLEVSVLYPGIFCMQKRITLLTWVLPLSNSFRGSPSENPGNLFCSLPKSAGSTRADTSPFTFSHNEM